MARFSPTISKAGGYALVNKALESPGVQSEESLSHNNLPDALKDLEKKLRQNVRPTDEVYNQASGHTFPGTHLDAAIADIRANPPLV